MAITVSRSGLPFAVAYFFTHPRDLPKEQGNLCPFFWRMLGMLLVLLLWTVLWLPVGFVLGLLCAARPRIVRLDGPAEVGDWDDSLFALLERLFVPYSRWPRLPDEGSKGPRIFPLVVLVILAILYLGLFTFWGRIVFAAVAVIVAGAWADHKLEQEGRYFWFLGDRKARTRDRGTPKPKSAGFVKLAWLALKARLAGLCPVITFVD